MRNPTFPTPFMENSKIVEMGLATTEILSHGRKRLPLFQRTLSMTSPNSVSLTPSQILPPNMIAVIAKEGSKA